MSLLKHVVVAALVTAAAAAARADEVVLMTGDVLVAPKVVHADGRVRMDHPILGHLDLPEAQVSEIRIDGVTTTITSGGAAPVVVAPPPAPPPPPKWKFKAELGLNGEHGNTRTQDLRTAVGALLETVTDRWKFDAEYLRSKNNGVVVKNQWYVQGIKDWMWADSPWTVFATGRFERDHFNAWSQRAQAGGGVGYKFVDREDLKVRGRAGLNGLREWGSGDDRWRPEGLLGAEAEWNITKKQRIEATTTWYPDLRQGGDWRLVSTLAWSMKLADSDALSLKIGLEDEYDTHRLAPFHRNDLKYFAAILYEF